MKSLFTVLAILFFLANIKAAEGDTTRVQSHQNTHWDWNGNWYDTTQFPATGEYRRILMYYTLGCPGVGCSEWDYTTKIEIGDEVNDSTTRWVEMTRIITPYAGDKNSSWKHTWVIDVTDYAPILNGERIVRAHYGGWQNGFTVTVDFDFIEGTPPREVLEVSTLYDGTFKYGFSTNPIEDHLVPTDIAIHADAASAKHRLVASGHSFGGNENCAEFCKKWYSLKVNNTEAVKEDVWRDDCGSNPLEGQTGTWIYDRAGWCPGAQTKRFDTEIGLFITAGQDNEFNIDWESYNYTGGAGFDPQYIIESTIFQYGDWNFQTDVAIDDVTKPSMNDRVWDVNPICNNPEVVISNSGADNVTKVSFEFWVQGSPEIIRHEGTGSLVPGHSTTVSLPAYDKWLFGGKTKNIFHVKIVGVNLGEDGYEGNNHFQSRFEDTPVFPDKIVIAYNSNAAGNETKYKVVSDRGDVIYERNSGFSNTAYTDTVKFDSPGCYTLKVTDSGCDGLSFFANNDGNGRIWLHSGEDGEFFPPLHMFDNEFGCEQELSFTVGYQIGEEETMDYPTGIAELGTIGMKAYPNPTSDNLIIQVDGELGGTLQIFNQSGQLVSSQNLQGNGVEVNGLPVGVYTAQYVAGSNVAHLIFVVID